MKIAVCSPISPHDFCSFLDSESRKIAETLSNNIAPAVNTVVKEFINFGHEVSIYTLDIKADKAFQLTGKNLTIYVQPLRPASKWKKLYEIITLKNVDKLRKMINKSGLRPDIVSVHWTREYALAAKTFDKSIPICVTVRDILPYIVKTTRFNPKNLDLYMAWLMNERVMRSDRYRFIANSGYTASMIERYWHRQSSIIPNPILEKYLHVAHKPQGHIFNITTISTAPPDDNRKNIYTLVKAFKDIKNSYPEARLNLIGGCFVPEYPAVVKWREEGLLDGVVLKGPMSHDEVVNFLAETQLMVHPSLEETFGNTLVEAMAVECPVMGGKDSGAVPYVLDHGKAGTLVDVTSVQCLTQAISDVIRSYPVYLEKAAKAKDFCRINFSSRSIATKYIDFFENVIKSYRISN